MPNEGEKLSRNFEFLLDSSAILAYLQREHGADQVELILDRAAVTAINVLEVLTRLCGAGATPDQARQAFLALDLEVIPFDEALALDAADLSGYARSHGLSVGDRACLAAARRFGVTAVSTDRAWRIKGLAIQVRIIR